MAAIEDRRTESEEPDEARSTLEERERDRRRDRLRLRREVRILEPGCCRGDYFFKKSGRGLSHELVEADRGAQEPSRNWMRKFRHTSLPTTSLRASYRPGAATSRASSFDSIFYYIKPTEKQVNSWEGPYRQTSRTRGTSWASRRPRRSISPGSAPSTSPRSSTTKVRRRLEKQKTSSSSTWTRACAARGTREAVLRDDHPAERSTSLRR